MTKFIVNNTSRQHRINFPVPVLLFAKKISQCSCQCRYCKKTKLDGLGSWTSSWLLPRNYHWMFSYQNRSIRAPTLTFKQKFKYSATSVGAVIEQSVHDLSQLNRIKPPYQTRAQAKLGRNRGLGLEHDECSVRK